MAIIAPVRPEVPGDPFLPLQDAAEWYGVDPSTLYRLLKKGDLTRHRRQGDKRTYLATTELEEKLRPKPVE
jgi:predicted site-specific integrase-resolvase